MHYSALSQHTLFWASAPFWSLKLGAYATKSYGELLLNGKKFPV
jgi:hypothetical protein